jgi:cytochrome b561
MLKNSATNYGALSKTLHWLIALGIIMLIIVGVYMTGLDKADPTKREIIGIHKSFGSLMMMLIVFRLIWLRISPAPALPLVFNAKEKLLTKGVHKLLYVLMLLTPFSGYIMSNAGGYPVSFFGLFELPALIDKSKAIGGFAHEAHEILAFTMLAFVVLHVAGAIKHRLQDRDGERDILNRML